MQWINICIELLEVSIAKFIINLLFFRQLLNIWNYNKSLAFIILNACDFVLSGRITEYTCNAPGKKGT